MHINDFKPGAHPVLTLNRLAARGEPSTKFLRDETRREAQPVLRRAL